MSTDLLQIRAGREAWLQIQERGLRADDISLLMGASGGPKWFILQGLDRFLFGDFFAHRQRPLDLLGSSAGGWRFAALGQTDPVAASELFCQLYTSQTYSEKPDIAEITDEARKLLHQYVPDHVVPGILAQNKFHHHMVVVRCKGLTAYEGKRQLAGMLLAAGASSIKRAWLGKFYERVVFHHPQSDCRFSRDWHDLPTTHVALTPENFKSALLATGSIPMVLDGVRDIANAPNGVYRDGGITDYHFDVDLSAVDGLILYPHFYSHVIPGWFDKALSWRRTTGKQWPKVILMAPSAEFVASLPYGKIPDRKDFAALDVKTRFAYWREAVAQGQRLAEQLQEWIATDQIRSKVKLWTP